MFDLCQVFERFVNTCRCRDICAPPPRLREQRPEPSLQLLVRHVVEFQVVDVDAPIELDHRPSPPRSLALVLRSIRRLRFGLAQEFLRPMNQRRFRQRLARIRQPRSRSELVIEHPKMARERQRWRGRPRKRGARAGALFDPG